LNKKFQIMFEGLTKKLGQKKQKKQKYFPECQWLGTRGRGASPSARDKALGEEVSFPECHKHGTRGNIYLFFVFFAPIFLWCLPTLFKTLCPNLAYFWSFLLYFVSIFVIFRMLLVMSRQQDAWYFMWVIGKGLNIHQISWISFFESPNYMISCTCSSNLNFS
jgi:hypothetical protein